MLLVNLKSLDVIVHDTPLAGICKETIAKVQFIFLVADLLYIQEQR